MIPESELDRIIRGGTPLPDTRHWRALAEHFEEVRELRMLELFTADPGRFDRYSVDLDGMLFDFSKNRITDATLALLIELARAAGIAAAIEAMFGGRRINWTEDRAVLHTALRHRSSEPVVVEGADVMPAIRAVPSTSPFLASN